jgi:glutathione peroxidase
MRSLPFVFASLLLACQATPAPTPSKAEPAAQPAAPAPALASEAAPTPEQPAPAAAADVLIDHSVKLLDGSDKSLADYRGKALLIVNTASECGYTPQYAQLQQLYATYKDKGLEVLAFPSNDFGAQEPGTPEQIREFVDSKYAVEFTMFDKIATTGPDKVPLYRTLTESTPAGIAGEVKWNFTKFLVAPDGRVIARFEPGVEPMDPQLTSAIEHALPNAG